MNSYPKRVDSQYLTNSLVLLINYVKLRTTMFCEVFQLVKRVTHAKGNNSLQPKEGAAGNPVGK